MTFRAGMIGMGLWIPETIRENHAWPESFVEASRHERAARRAQDFARVERTAVDRPHDALFARHADRYHDDPFKGAIRRHVADPTVPTVEGDVQAAKAALADAQLSPRDIDLVLSSAVVQDALVPSNGPAIQEMLGCTRAPGVGVEAYCSSALAQFDIAAGLVEAGRAKFVLCVQSHQIGRINDLEIPVSPIFGDGSSAFVVGQAPEGRGLAHIVRGGDGSLRGAVTHAYKETPGATWWRNATGPVVPGVEDPGAAARLVHNILRYPIETVRELCTATRIPIDAIDVLAMIQPVCWYQEAVADGLGISPQRVPTTYERYAHLGGAGVIANLIEARHRGLLHDDARVVLYAHGAGITRYAALLHWHSAKL